MILETRKPKKEMSAKRTSTRAWDWVSRERHDTGRPLRRSERFKTRRAQRLVVSGSSKLYFLLTCMHIGGVRTSEGNASVSCIKVIRTKYGSQKRQRVPASIEAAKLQGTVWV